MQSYQWPKPHAESEHFDRFLVDMILDQFKESRLKVFGRHSFHKPHAARIAVVAHPVVPSVMSKITYRGKTEIDRVRQGGIDREILVHAPYSHLIVLRESQCAQPLPHNIAAYLIGERARNHAHILHRECLVRVACYNPGLKDIKKTAVGQFNAFGRERTSVVGSDIVLMQKSGIACGSRHLRRIALEAGSKGSGCKEIFLVLAILHKALRNTVYPVGVGEESIVGLFEINLGDKNKAHRQADRQAHYLGDIAPYI